MKILFYLIWLNLLCFSFNLSGQARHFKFDQYNSRDGLSHRFVTDIVQDELGFLWFSTRDGLNRYDGNSFKVYRHSKGDSTSLSSNIILCLFIDSEKNLWTGFEDFGAAKYNRELDNFTNYLPVTGDSTTLSQGTVYCIFEDVQNRIWMGTHNGLNRLQDNDSFKHYLNDANNKHSLTGSAIRCITSDENNNFRTPDPIP